MLTLPFSGEVGQQEQAFCSQEGANDHWTNYKHSDWLRKSGSTEEEWIKLSGCTCALWLATEVQGEGKRRCERNKRIIATLLSKFVAYMKMFLLGRRQLNWKAAVGLLLSRASKVLVILESLTFAAFDPYVTPSSSKSCEPIIFPFPIKREVVHYCWSFSAKWICREVMGVFHDMPILPGLISSCMK